MVFETEYVLVMFAAPQLQCHASPKRRWEEILHNQYFSLAHTAVSRIFVLQELL